jgi:hypothetical protein
LTETLEKDLSKNCGRASLTVLDLESKVCHVCDNRVVRAYEAEARPGLGWSVTCSLWVQEDLGVRVEVFDVEVGSGEVVVVDCDRDISYCSVGGIVWTDALCDG